MSQHACQMGAESSSIHVSPQQAWPCDPLAGTQGKWDDESCPAEQGVSTVGLPACWIEKPCFLGWALVPMGGGRLLLGDLH